MEIEAKYRAGYDSFQKMLRDLGAPPIHIIEMRACYYDVYPLRKERVALRRREQNGAVVWTVKVSSERETGASVSDSAVSQRYEWECEADGEDEALARFRAIIPDSHSYIIDALSGAPLKKSVEMEFTREESVVTISEPHVLTVALSYDRGVLQNGAKSAPLEEMEIELKQGDNEHFLNFINKIEKKYNLTPDYDTKLKKALAL